MSEAIFDQKEQQKQFILNESLWKVMFTLSWPAVIAMVLYGCNMMLDAYFVGRYVGETALAGVSLAYPITMLSTGLGTLVGVGAGSVLSIALGAKDMVTQKKLLGNVNALTLMCTVFYMIIGLAFSTQFLAMMGGEGEALTIGNEYFRITVYGTVFWIFGIAVNMIIRGEGKMKTAAWMMGMGLVANAIFNYIFIVLMDMGVAGAAWGTNIGMSVYCLLGIIYFSRGKATFQSNVFSIHFDKILMGDTVRLGVTSLIMSVMTLLQAVIVFNALSTFGTLSDIAFYGVVFRIFQFLLTPTFGLMRALQPVVGINFGAKQYDRVIKSYYIFSVVAMMLTLPFWFASLVAPNLILETMLTEQAITAVQINCFRIYMAILPLMSFVFMGMTFFPSVGKAKPAAMIGIARQFVFYVPVILVLPRFFGVESIYYASFAIDAIITIWTVWLVQREFALLKKRK